jgi:rsbT co-antagonist protein RsbR
VLGLLLSIMDHVRTEDALRAIVETLPSFIMLLDQEHRMLFINRVVAGLSMDQVIGASAYTFIPPEFHSVARQAYEEAWRTRKPTRYELKGPGHHGALAWYASYVGPVIKDGEVVALTLATEDITERKLAEEAREASEVGRKQLEEDLRDALLQQKRYAEELEQKNRQLYALSTPIIQAWEGVLVLPVIGSLDSARAQQMMEKLLAEIARTRARFAVLDLTGVDAVDASTVDHMLRIVRAASLLGSRCLVSGISPRVARTMVEVAASQEGLLTFGLLQDALRYALRSSGVFQGESA